MKNILLNIAANLWVLLFTVNSILKRRLVIPLLISRNENRILSGPFKGMIYDVTEGHGSAWIPKIYGKYESELHATINEIIQTRLPFYDVLIDIGSADGYYLIGFGIQSKMKNKDLDLIGFELEKKSQNESNRLAKLNLVENVELFGKCKRKDLVEVTKKYNHGLVICDCEGCEYNLFTEDTIDRLLGFDLLIEVHELEIEDTAFNIFTHRLSQKFNLSIIGDTEIIDLTEYDFKNLPDKLLKEIFKEGREKSVGWIFAKSKEI